MELSNIYTQLPNETDAISFLEKLIWVGSVTCPYCKSKDITPVKESKRHHCNTCNTSFSVTVNTIFHRTKVDLQKWIYLLYLMKSGKKMPSLRALAEDLKLTKDTVGKMIHRVNEYSLSGKELIDKILNNIDHAE